MLAVYHEDSGQAPLAVGDELSLTMNGQQQKVTVVGLVSQSPFVNASDLGTLITSEDTFCALTGENAYSVIDLQLAPGASDADVNAIRAQAGTAVTSSTTDFRTPAPAARIIALRFSSTDFWR